MSSDHPEESEDVKIRLNNPVFLECAEASVGPWWKLQIQALIKQNRPEDAGALFREFETPENGI